MDYKMNEEKQKIIEAYEQTVNEGEVMDMVKQIMSDLKTVIKLTAQERKMKAGFVKIDKELAKLVNMMAAEKEKQNK
jgi:hypothetical protein